MGKFVVSSISIAVESRLLSPGCWVRTQQLYLSSCWVRRRQLPLEPKYSILCVETSAITNVVMTIINIIHYEWHAQKTITLFLIEKTVPAVTCRPKSKSKYVDQIRYEIICGPSPSQLWLPRAICQEGVLSVLVPCLDRWSGFPSSQSSRISCLSMPDECPYTAPCQMASPRLGSAHITLPSDTGTARSLGYLNNLQLSLSPRQCGEIVLLQLRFLQLST